jgi:hypothetical protein
MANDEPLISRSNKNGVAMATQDALNRVEQQLLEDSSGAVLQPKGSLISTRGNWIALRENLR